MKDRMERFVILPFSLGCSSQSSVDVANTHHHSKKPNPPIKKEEEEEEGESSKHEEEEEEDETKMDDPRGNESEAVSPKHIGNNNNNNNNNDISVGIFRFIRSFKTFSHSFFIRYGDSTEETEAEMEIGFPTDVKHVTHIGIDGTMTTFDVASTPSSFPFGRFQLATV
ncbi:PREDICTED: CRIB domain-containing protein RIC4-like isoform X2 [Tarenaya hassleriana]|uniref:CRIB domain-containing protein RIC4-like isoform X2 n=1 Tax=Tarenaya hassleriana TaxID=28532 RepID=UPI00053C1784|nr:PREDICTED: CRIB domain-containing protein RIC4-like isoform X2 [Tarenaya hassleriana]